jgi:hypothetical protein
MRQSMAKTVWKKALRVDIRVLQIEGIRSNNLVFLYLCIKYKLFFFS